MISLAARHKIYMTSGGAALLIAILISAVVLLIGAIKNQGEALMAKKQTLENFYADSRNFGMIERNYQKLLADFSGQPALINSQENVKFIMSLEEIARQNSISQRISVINKKGEESVLELQVFLRGAFGNFMKYLISLENLSYLNDAESMQITRLTNKEIKESQEFQGLKEGDINASLVLSVYLQK